MKKSLAWVSSTWMDQSLEQARSKRYQEELGDRLNSLMEEREEEAKLIYFSQLLE